MAVVSGKPALPAPAPSSRIAQLPGPAPSSPIAQLPGPAPSSRIAQRPAPAPSSRIAQAARAFGDSYPPLKSQWRTRAAGIAVLITGLFYVPWMLMSLNSRYPWLAWPFAAANMFSVGYGLLTLVNGWQRRVPERRPLPRGEEPEVAVIIPTCGEPIAMILRTITSVLEQDWPAKRRTVVVSDDAHDPQLQGAVEPLGLIYYSPLPRDAPGRDGAAKAGNLNSAMDLLDSQHPGIDYVETRDADDEMGSNGFLRETIGQLAADERLAFVQTIKEAQVSAGDPFNNRETMFYRGQMLARNAANAAFPCGSGVVWRRAALRDIGGFPTWNLVEDVQSGVEALRRGWRGMYLPIVGAVPQHAPEDVPSAYKQRGTWAIDTVRLLIWRSLSGMNLRQRLQFWEMFAFYANAFTTFVYIPAIVASLLGRSPLNAGGTAYLVHLLPYALSIELWLLVLNHPYNDRRKGQRKRYQTLWQARIMWTGMSPVYAKAFILAILGGPNHKPVYKVTRKHDDFRWHWRHTLPQTSLVLLIAFALIYGLANGTLPGVGVLIGTVYWGGLNIVLLTGFLAHSWHGIQRGARSSGLQNLPGGLPRAEPGAGTAP